MRGLRGVCIAICGALLLAACAAPGVHHVGAGTPGLFFDVPRDWSEIDSKLLVKAQSGWNSDQAGAAVVSSLTWQSAWRVDSEIGAEAVFANTVPQTPIVYASARTLLDAEASAISSDILTALQDVVIQVSTAVAGDGLVITKNSYVVRAGHDSVVQQLTWKQAGTTQTAAVLLILSSNHSTLYTVISRCSNTCWTDYSSKINAIMASITVKEPQIG